MCAVLADAASALTDLPGEIGSEARAVLTQLSGPLRVGVVGSVSAGKSTLVNALLERAIAPTAAGETTRVPAWFSWAPHDSALVISPDGTPSSLELTEDRLPNTLPTGEAVPGVYIDVTLPRKLLQRVTIIDTPGIASTNTDVSERTTRLIKAGTNDSAAKVEALVVVLTGTLLAEEAEVVAALTERVPNVGVVPAVAALTRVDTLDVTDPEKAFAKGAELAAATMAQHPHMFADVVPVSGLMAETARTGALTGADVRALAAIAVSCPPQWRGDALADLAMFEEWELPGVEVGMRRRLYLDLLGAAGLRLCLNHLDSHPGAGAPQLQTLLVERSGVGRLTNVLRATLTARADLLKGAVALRSLSRLLAHPQLPSHQSDALGSRLDSPVLAPLELAAALADLRRSRRPLPPDLAAEATLAARGQLPVEDLRQANRSVALWRGWAATADGRGRRAADAMCRAWLTALTGSVR